MSGERLHRVPPTVLQRARQLRRPMTPAEAKLWRHLRGRRFEGLKFRRQYALEPFIVDFYCAAAAVIIEIDGDSHAVQKEYDRERTAWLTARGYRVIRFQNRDVLHNIEGVLAKILEACKPSPYPSP